MTIKDRIVLNIADWRLKRSDKWLRRSSKCLVKASKKTEKARSIINNFKERNEA